MPHPEPAWRAEIQAHRPQSRDLVELSLQVPDLADWRADILVDPDLQADLEEWEAFIHANTLAVPIEQAAEEGLSLEDCDEKEIAAALEGCPEDLKDAVLEFARGAVDTVRMYLAYHCYILVQIERQRRTGSADWHTEAASGSPEVLRELMFKWGPRFHRHRWTW